MCRPLTAGEIWPDTVGMDDEIEAVRAELLALGRQEWFSIHEETQVPFSTIKHFAYRQTKCPRATQFLAIREALTKRRKKQRKAA